MICKQLLECINDKNQQCKRERECIEYTDERSNVKCEEKRKKYILRNDDRVRVRKYKMDNGIVKNELGFEACDNLLVVYGTDAQKMIFIELKGRDLKHAVSQTYETIKYFAPSLRAEKVYARIVHTQGTPKIKNSGQQVDLERMVRKFGGNLKMCEWELDEKLSALDKR